MIAGLIYAGGRATRMGGADKPLLPLAGAALIGWAATRLRPQVDRLAVSARGDPARFAFLHAPVLADPPSAEETGLGPIGGLVAGAAWAQGLGARWLATAPADAPFAPEDFVAPLIAAAEAQNAMAAMAQTPSGREPAFAVWRADQAEQLQVLAAGGVRALHAAADALGATACLLPAAPAHAFFNINTPDDLAHAERLVSGLGLRPPPFSAE